jgi:hypothetical protein
MALTELAFSTHNIDTRQGMYARFAQANRPGTAITLPRALTGTGAVIFFPDKGMKTCDLKMVLGDPKDFKDNIAGLALLAHELTHAAQIYHAGSGAAFLRNYLAEMDHWAKQGLGFDDAYHCNRYEIEGHAVQYAILDVLNSEKSMQMFAGLCQICNPDPQVADLDRAIFRLDFEAAYKRHLVNQQIACQQKVKK